MIRAVAEDQTEPLFLLAVALILWALYGIDRLAAWNRSRRRARRTAAIATAAAALPNLADRRAA